MNKILIILLIFITLLFLKKKLCKEEFKSIIYNNVKKKLPPGNWNDSCLLLDYRHPLIWAECKNKKGVYKTASKDLSRCLSKNLSNIDGELQCDNN